MSPSTGAKVLGYVRVSTEDQAREGVSLDAQEARLRDYCRAREWALVGVIRDEGRSAKDLKRPGLEQILEALPRKHRGWDALIVVKLDRLTRSVKDLGTLMEAFKRARVAFTSIQESVDTSSASGELFFNLVASVSQWERRAIGERTKAALAHLQASGRRVSRFAPYGQRIAADGRLVPDPVEQAVRRAVASLARRRLSLRAMAARLAAQGHVSRTGQPFTPKAVKRLLAG